MSGESTCALALLCLDEASQKGRVGVVNCLLEERGVLEVEYFQHFTQKGIEFWKRTADKLNK
jgi:hypothetical protein